jgi:hypothetical protein
LPSPAAASKVGGFSDRNAAGSGDEAMASKLLLVITGVWCMYGRIFWYAAAMDDGIRGGHVDGSAMTTPNSVDGIGRRLD